LIPRLVDVEGVPKDDTVSIDLRQALRQLVERASAIACARHHNTTIRWDSMFIFHRRHKPRGVAVVRMHRHGKTEGRRIYIRTAIQ
jgi:hypothetical protein